MLCRRGWAKQGYRVALLAINDDRRVMRADFLEAGDAVPAESAGALPQACTRAAGPVRPRPRQPVHRATRRARRLHAGVSPRSDPRGSLSEAVGWIRDIATRFKRPSDVQEPREPQASVGDDGGYGGPLVPAGTTIGQILDYVGGSGDNWPLDFYSFGLGVSRNSAVTYASLFRTVTLVAGVVAQLIAGGNLSVVDPDGRRRTGRRVGPRDGDAHLVARRWRHAGVFDDRGRAVRLPARWQTRCWCRCSMRKATPSACGGCCRGIRTSREASLAGRCNRVTPVDSQGSVTEYHASRDVLHVRWPRLLRYGRSRSTREGFAIAPVVAMRPALSIGLHGDRYIQSWFQRGAQGKLHFQLHVSGCGEVFRRRSSALS